MRLFSPARLFPTLLQLSLIVALAVLLAHWTWALLAPKSIAAPAPAPVAQGAATIAAAHLFGREATGQTAAVSTLNVKLNGVYAAAPGSAGFAVLTVDGRNVAVVQDAEVMPGVKLQRVNADHVILDRQGRLERINLPERKAVPAPR